MPLTEKGKKIMGAMKKTYGSEKGKEVFYATESKGEITGAHKKGSKREKQLAAMRKIHDKKK